MKSINSAIAFISLAIGACTSATEDQSVFTTPLKPTKPSSNQYLMGFMASDFNLVHSTKDIDPVVLNLVRGALGFDPRIVEPNEHVQFSDVMEPGNLPNHRLVLAGRSNNLWFIVLFEGGFAPNHQFILLSNDAGSWRFVFAGTLPYRKTSTLTAIRREIAKGELYVNPTDHRFRITRSN